MARLMGRDFVFTYSTSTGTFVPEVSEVVEYSMQAQQPQFEATPATSNYEQVDHGTISLRGTLTVNCTTTGDCPIPNGISGILKIARNKGGTSADYWQGLAHLEFLRFSGTSLGGGPHQRAVFGWRFNGEPTIVN